jgi:hypothetical protein
MAEREFPKGVYFNLPRENAPEFVLGSIALNLAWMDREQLNSKKNEKWYVYLDVLRGKDWKPYVAFNEYKAEKKEEKKPLDVDDIAW